MKPSLVILGFALSSQLLIADTVAECLPVLPEHKAVAHRIEFVKSETEMYAVLDGTKSLCHHIAVPLSSVRTIEGRQVGKWAVCGVLPFLNGPWIGDDHAGFYTSYETIDYRCETKE